MSQCRRRHSSNEPIWIRRWSWIVVSNVVARLLEPRLIHDFALDRWHARILSLSLWLLFHRFIIAVQSVDLFEHIFLAIDISAAVPECSSCSCGRHRRRTSIARPGEYARLHANTRKRRSTRNRWGRTTEFIDTTTITNTKHITIRIKCGQFGRCISSQSIAFACTDLVAGQYLWKGIERRFTSIRSHQTRANRFNAWGSAAPSNDVVDIKYASRIAGQFLRSGRRCCGRCSRCILTTSHGIVVIVIFVVIAVIQQVIYSTLHCAGAFRPNQQNFN